VVIPGFYYFYQFVHRILWQIVGIYFAEVLKGGATMRIQPLSVVVQFTDYSGEVEIQHQIPVPVRG
ncbi:hypothetical protein L0N02_20740, partial [Blautia faecis]|nr:hypothetical protein [Blautia faecis]